MSVPSGNTALTGSGIAKNNRNCMRVGVNQFAQP